MHSGGILRGRNRSRLRSFPQGGIRQKRNQVPAVSMFFALLVRPLSLSQDRHPSGTTFVCFTSICVTCDLPWRQRQNDLSGAGSDKGSKAPRAGKRCSKVQRAERSADVSGHTSGNKFQSTCGVRHPRFHSAISRTCTHNSRHKHVVFCAIIQHIYPGLAKAEHLDALLGKTHALHRCSGGCTLIKESVFHCWRAGRTA